MALLTSATSKASVYNDANAGTFTQAQLDSIMNAALDYFIKGQPLENERQARPLYDAMRSKSEVYPGGNTSIRRNVKGKPEHTMQGYAYTDTVSYGNRGNVDQAQFDWKELHDGLSVTFTELKQDGITVTDSANGASTSNHSKADVTRIHSLLKDKLNDMMEGYEAAFNAMLWDDGTQDSTLVPGIQSVITDIPASGDFSETVGGITTSRTGATEVRTWWRNRASVLVGAVDGRVDVTGATIDSPLMTAVRNEMRQLRRYGKGPDMVLCGSEFMETLEAELFAKGILTQQGFANGTATNFDMSEPKFGKLKFEYDPSLDDLGASDDKDFLKRAYFIDTSRIKLYDMDGEVDRIHHPARPHDQYALYRAITYTGALCCWQRNTSMVMEFK